MTYPWANGDVLTHADLNTEIKRPHVCTSGTRPAHAQGLTIYETDTGVTYQSDGTTWQFISAPTHVCYAHRSSTQSIPLTTPTDVGFNAETLDPLGMHSTSGSDWNFTIPAGGSVPGTYVYYEVFASLGMESISAGFYFVELYNATTAATLIKGPLAPQQGASFGLSCSLSGIVRLTPGDVIKVRANNVSTGGVRNVEAGQEKTYIRLRRIG